MEVASIGEKWAGLRKTTFMKKITSHNSFEQWWYVGFGKEANVGLRIWGFSNLKEIDNQDRTVSTIVAAQSREEVFKSFEESEKKNMMVMVKFVAWRQVIDMQPWIAWNFLCKQNDFLSLHSMRLNVFTTTYNKFVKWLTRVQQNQIS